MIELRQVSRVARLCALTLAALTAATLEQAFAQPAPAVPETPIQATIANNHRESIEAYVWVDGLAYKLGDMRAGERRTFTLPSAVSSGARYYLMGWCPTGDRINSDPLTATTERHARFVVGRTARDSYVRLVRSPTDVEQRSAGTEGR